MSLVEAQSSLVKIHLIIYIAYVRQPEAHNTAVARYINIGGARDAATQKGVPACHNTHNYD